MVEVSFLEKAAIALVKHVMHRPFSQDPCMIHTFGRAYIQAKALIFQSIILHRCRSTRSPEATEPHLLLCLSADRGRV